MSIQIRCHFTYKVLYFYMLSSSIQAFMTTNLKYTVSLSLSYPVLLDITAHLPLTCQNEEMLSKQSARKH